MGAASHMMGDVLFLHYGNKWKFFELISTHMCFLRKNGKFSGFFTLDMGCPRVFDNVLILLQYVEMVEY